LANSLEKRNKEKEKKEEKRKKKGMIKGALALLGL